MINFTWIRNQRTNYGLNQAWQRIRGYRCKLQTRMGLSFVRIRKIHKYENSQIYGEDKATRCKISSNSQTLELCNINHQARLTTDREVANPESKSMNEISKMYPAKSIADKKTAVVHKEMF